MRHLLQITLISPQKRILLTPQLGQLGSPQIGMSCTYLSLLVLLFLVRAAVGVVDMENLLTSTGVPGMKLWRAVFSTEF